MEEDCPTHTAAISSTRICFFFRNLLVHSNVSQLADKTNLRLCAPQSFVLTCLNATEPLWSIRTPAVASDAALDETQGDAGEAAIAVNASSLLSVAIIGLLLPCSQPLPRQLRLIADLQKRNDHSKIKTK